MTAPYIECPHCRTLTHQIHPTCVSCGKLVSDPIATIRSFVTSPVNAVAFGHVTQDDALAALESLGSHARIEARKDTKFEDLPSPLYKSYCKTCRHYCSHLVQEKTKCVHCVEGATIQREDMPAFKEAIAKMGS